MPDGHDAGGQGVVIQQIGHHALQPACFLQGDVEEFIGFIAFNHTLADGMNQSFD
ncbi:hypothetical protein D3C75_616400 [compost metagenome]